MNRMVFAGILLFAAESALAQDDTVSTPAASNPRRPSTLVSVRALANTPSPGLEQPNQPEVRGIKDSVAEMARVAKDKQKDPEDRPKRRDEDQQAKKDESKAVHVDRPRRGDANEFTRQPLRRPQNDVGQLPAGQAYQPMAVDPFYGNWSNSVYSGGITGYRSFGTSGYGFVRANSFQPFGYSIYTYYGLGYGFPTASVSGPVTIMYDPAQVRRWSRVADGIQRPPEIITSGSR